MYLFLIQPLAAISNKHVDDDDKDDDKNMQLDDKMCNKWTKTSRHQQVVMYVWTGPYEIFGAKR